MTMPEDDPSHQFQMLLKPLTKAIQQQNVEAAVRFAGHLLEIGGGIQVNEDRKVHFLLRALEGASAALKTEFTAKVVERYGGRLSDESRGRLSRFLERL